MCIYIYISAPLGVSSTLLSTTRSGLQATLPLSYQQLVRSLVHTVLRLDLALHEGNTLVYRALQLLCQPIQACLLYLVQLAKVVDLPNACSAAASQHTTTAWYSMACLMMKSICRHCRVRLYAAAVASFRSPGAKTRPEDIIVPASLVSRCCKQHLSCILIEKGTDLQG